MADRRVPPPLPPSVNAFNKLRGTFEAWLAGRGSAVKQPTSPYEVMRFSGPQNECIVYRKANNTISHWANGADKAFRAFLDQTEWRAVDRGRRDQRTVNLILSLAARDGWGCAYCLAAMDMASATIEHFCPVTSGGNSHLANLSLCCAPCNAAAGCLPVRAKLEMAVRKRRAAMGETAP